MTTEQAAFFALLAGELITAWRSAPDIAFRDLPEYSRFLHGAYARGLVCRDSNGPAFEERMVGTTRDPDQLWRASLAVVRRCIHTVPRSERLGDAGAASGGGVVIRAVETGALAIIAERLASDSSRWAGQSSLSMPRL